MADFFEVVHAITLIIVAVYVPISLGLFWQLRYYQPIKSSRKFLTLIGALLIVAAAAVLSLSDILPNFLTYFSIHVLVRVMILAAVDIWLVIGVQLYVAFAHTHIILDLESATGADLKKLLRDQKRYLTFLKWASSQKTTVMILSVSTAISASPAFIALAIDSEAILTSMSRPCPNEAVCDMVQKSMMVMMLLRIGVLFFTAVKLKMVQDVIGIKDRLKRIAISLSLILSTAFVLLLIIKKPRIFYLFTGIFMGNSIFIAEIVYPVFLILSRQRRELGAFDVSGGHPLKARTMNSTISKYIRGIDEDLHQFLRTPEGLKLFKAHMTKEFAVESIIFLVELDSFKEAFVKNGESSTLHYQACRIARNFIDDKGVMSLNVSSVTRKAILEKFGDIDLRNLQDDTARTEKGCEDLEASSPYIPLEDGGIFDVVQAEVLQLLADDSLQRFRKVPEHESAWKKFLLGRQQEALVENIGQGTALTSNQSQPSMENARSTGLGDAGSTVVRIKSAASGTSRS